MTALLASTTATSPTATEGNVKTYLANLREFIADLLGTDSANKAAVQGLLGNILNGKVTKTGAYTVVAADRGKVIDCSGSWTLSLASAATLGDGFSFAVRNSGSGAITVDPNLSEQINGLTTIIIGAGEFVIIYCDGVSFSTVGGSSSPVGTVSAYAGTSIPVGWLQCSGQSLSTTSYPLLFSAIGYTYGGSGGSFNLPDLRGEFIRGLDSGRGVDSGRVLGSSQSSQNLAHTHTASLTEGGTLSPYVPVASLGAATQTMTTNSSGGSEARPRNVALYYIIKT